MRFRSLGKKKIPAYLTAGLKAQAGSDAWKALWALQLKCSDGSSTFAHIHTQGKVADANLASNVCISMFCPHKFRLLFSFFFNVFIIIKGQRSSEGWKEMGFFLSTWLTERTQGLWIGHFCKYVELNPNKYYQDRSQLQDFPAYLTTLEDAFTVIIRDAVKIPLTFINMTDIRICSITLCPLWWYYFGRVIRKISVCILQLLLKKEKRNI